MRAGYCGGLTTLERVFAFRAVALRLRTVFFAVALARPRTLFAAALFFAAAVFFALFLRVLFFLLPAFAFAISALNFLSVFLAESSTSASAALTFCAALRANACSSTSASSAFLIALRIRARALAFTPGALFLRVANVHLPGDLRMRRISGHLRRDGL